MKTGIMKTGIGSHTKAVRGQTDDYITPQAILKALGDFDMDPCACNPQPWPTAEKMIRLPENGLEAHWQGRIWLNPPYGQQTHQWLSRMAAHNHGTALIFARTETAMFFKHVWARASGLLFIEGRLYFHRPDGRKMSGNAGGPSVLVAYGRKDAQILAACDIAGAFVVPSISRKLP